MELDIDISIDGKLVRNQKPTSQATYRIALVGEAPGADEETAGVPFVGASGYTLDQLLAKAGIDRSTCLVANVAQYRPPRNDIQNFKWDGPQIQQGLAQLQKDIEEFDPHIVVLLGNVPLHVAKCGNNPPPLKKGRWDFPNKVTNWKGSLFVAAEGPLAGRKCVSTYHPAAVLRNYDWMPILLMNLKRARQQGESPGLSLPERRFELSPTCERVCQLLDEIPDGTLTSIDIEGGVSTGMVCISVSTHPLSGFIVPFARGDGSNYWSPDEEMRVLRSLSRMLSNPAIPKVLQNSLYDCFVLAWTHRIFVRNVQHDTMLLHWERYCELPKSLEDQASIYTLEPYYKSGRSTTGLSLYEYCCRDSAVTLEIQQRLIEQIKGTRLEHYRFNMGLLPIVLYIELRGTRYDSDKAAEKRITLQGEIAKVQELVDKAAGKPLNVKSSRQVADFLYTRKMLPIQTNRKTGAITTNEESLLNLIKKTNDKDVINILDVRQKRTRLGMLGIYADADGRIRASYNVVGTKTGRMGCSTSPTGSGYNLTTIPDYDQDLFLADEGYEYFKVDLSGADGWTVAAHCARLGDKTMIEDLLAGVKIAKVIALMFHHGPSIAGLSTIELKARMDEIDKNDKIYFAAKCCQHGSNYGMAKTTMAATILLKSEGKVVIPAKDCERLQKFYFTRYPGVLRWHRDVEHKLKTEGKLVSASGHVRFFFGRKNDSGTIRDALSYEPQANTTYLTNLAARRLWLDRRNRRENGSVIIEPLHQVHDALCGQYPAALSDECRRRIRGYFNNPITIAGQVINVPFEGGCGRSWGELTTDL